ncbi:hypothetical protein LCGC14_0653570 [marine sediment metagenome]|uniref:Uncharacterized protein n=1 Tax=marine sediment metagenome TaxID=412755 RepID=A0A0F9RFE8_9ZZZZ
MISGSDKTFLWLIASIIFAAFLFGGTPDLLDVLIGNLMGECPIIIGTPK